jgi:hypothetical protein
METWMLYIIEIPVPFGKGDKEEEHINTLKNVIEFKTNKYAPLVRSINKQLKEKNFKEKRFVVEFLPFIISSLGALRNKSINGFTRMIGTATKNTGGLWCKKLVVKVLKGSFMKSVKAKPETSVSNNRKKQENSSDEEEINEEERHIAEKIIESVEEALKLGQIYENEGDAERKNLVLGLVEEKERMNELNLSEEAIDDTMNDNDFEIYNNKVMNQEEVTDYREVQEEEESHQIERPENTKEIAIIRKSSEHPLIPEADDNNFGDKES